MTKVTELHQKWMKNNAYRRAYDDLAPQFALTRAVIEARVTARLTQEQVAQRMKRAGGIAPRRRRWSASPPRPEGG